MLEETTLTLSTSPKAEMTTLRMVVEGILAIRFRRSLGVQLLAGGLR